LTSSRMTCQKDKGPSRKHLQQIMSGEYYLERLISSKEFRFEKLFIAGMSNEPVLKVNSLRMAEEETCLFHRDVLAGDAYLETLQDAVKSSLAEKKMMPVVRFADGEYAFYGHSLHCNGLYRQAESVRAIRNVMPSHVDTLRHLIRTGKIAPLIFPGNIRPEKKKPFLFFQRSRQSVSATEFLEFLYQNQILLSRDNYIPFYVVYAYLTSEPFAKLMDGKRICIVSSDYNGDKCREWFERFSSRPFISFIDIPDSYVATRWDTMKAGILNRIPEDTDICLVGAGVGALLVCVDVADKYSIPAIDAGHVLNMMNGREDKSKGPRLYTMWE